MTRGNVQACNKKIVGQIFSSSDVSSIYLTPLNGFCFQVSIQSFLSHVKINIHSLLRYVVKTISVCPFWTCKLCFMSFASYRGRNYSTPTPYKGICLFPCWSSRVFCFPANLLVFSIADFRIKGNKSSQDNLPFIMDSQTRDQDPPNPSVPSNDTFLMYLLSRRSSANCSCSMFGLRQPSLKHCCGTLQRWF